MMNSRHPHKLLSGASTAILALLLGMATGTGSAQKKTAEPQSTKPAATRSTPSGGGSHGSTGATTHGSTSGGSHGTPSGGGSHGSSGAMTHGPTSSGTHSQSTGGGGTTTHRPATSGSNAHDGDGTHGNKLNGSTGGVSKNSTGGTKQPKGTHDCSTPGPCSSATGNKPTSAGSGKGTAGQFKPGKEGSIGAKTGGTGSHSTVPGYGRTPKGMTNHPLKGGANFTTRAGGKPAGFHDPSRGISTHHGLNGGYHGSVMHPDHSGVYLPMAARDMSSTAIAITTLHTSAAPTTTTVIPTTATTTVGDGAVVSITYAPGFYFGVGFYGWAYHPWYRPIGWGWGWGGSPWYGYYGGWFTPYPTYAAPAYWLTDYLIAQNLQAAYAAHQEGGEQAVAGGEGVMLTPEVKDQIAEEVRNQIALENQEAQQTAQGQAVDPGSSGIGRMLNDGKHHIFVAASALDVVDAGSGQECALSDGDVLQVAKTPAPDETTADLVVLASKGGNECQKASTVTVNFSDLQEMQNSMRMNLDNGLKELHAKQGTGGLPAAPPSATAAPTEAPYAAVAPPPDPNDAQQIQQQEQSSQQAEQQAAQDANGGGTGQQ